MACAPSRQDANTHQRHSQPKTETGHHERAHCVLLQVKTNHHDRYRGGAWHQPAGETKQGNLPSCNLLTGKTALDIFGVGPLVRILVSLITRKQVFTRLVIRLMMVMVMVMVMVFMPRVRIGMAMLCVVESLCGNLVSACAKKHPNRHPSHHQRRQQHKIEVCLLDNQLVAKFQGSSSQCPDSQRMLKRCRQARQGGLSHSSLMAMMKEAIIVLECPGSKPSQAPSKMAV